MAVRSAGKQRALVRNSFVVKQATGVIFWEIRMCTETEHRQLQFQASSDYYYYCCYYYHCCYNSKGRTVLQKKLLPRMRLEITVLVALKLKTMQLHYIPWVTGVCGRLNWCSLGWGTDGSGNWRMGWLSERDVRELVIRMLSGDLLSDTVNW